ncbi:NifU family protein [Skermania sp. ID1734]|uniref:NifU family protein n=1 Tax=Skermania sp. ID1734 TaxID=2597516 RepID=UPI00117FA3B6|nr:NifU family protein [Skermania sp. ID1734]TSE00949.1 NifU family protein [Skermania sp. ID1734]
MADEGPPRLRDAAVRERLSQLDDMLAQLEQTPGPAGEIALEAVSSLAQIYGEALARAVGYALESDSVRAAFVADELLGHLLAMHGIHPDPVEQRVSRVVDQLRPVVVKGGGDLQFVGLEAGVARVALSAKGCGSSTAGVADAVRDRVLAVAPELSGVEVVAAARHDATFVPLESLQVRTHSAAGARS